MQRLATKFVAASDEVWRLHNRKELDCLFFQGYCEEGHYGGRTRPTNTRQGIYCCTPSGKFLASINTSDPGRMAGMLEKALENWKKTPKAERYLDYDPAERAGEIRRREQAFPEDGLPLRVYSRDMPGKAARKGAPRDWRRTAWNVDSLWYRKAEARTMLPAKLEAGQETDWPEAIVGRLVRHNLVDNVRGQTNGYSAKQVQVGRIRTTIASVEKGVATVTFEGASRTTTTGTWPEDGTAPEGAGAWARGVRTTMYGEAEYDVEQGRFVRFELAAAGTRWGQTRYNFRRDDPEEGPIGFAIVLDPDDPGNRVAPAEMGAYGW